MPPTPLPSYIQDVLSKGITRLGRKQLWRISATLRALDSCDVYELREQLRRLGIFVEDAQFADMAEAYGALDPSTEAVIPQDGSLSHTGSGVASGSLNNSPSLGSTVTGPFTLTTVTAFMLGLIAAYSPRRRHILDVMLAALGVEKPELIGPSKPHQLLQEIPLSVLEEKYDVMRHPSVANDVLPVNEIRAKFYEALDFEGHATSISVEELMLYYLGISVKEPNDTYFELLCIRSFSLDRPRLNFEDELERLKGSSAVAHFNRMVGMPHNHPLYTTTYEDYGKEIQGGKPPRESRYGRSQKFSRSIPPHTGGATSMNM